MMSGVSKKCSQVPGDPVPRVARLLLLRLLLCSVQGEINLHVRSAPVTCSVASVSGVDYQ